jgi:LysR family transcriptional regulator, regulator for bpeEF and oprC
MWLASEMAAFAHVTDLGSFTAAARALGVPKVAVSRAIASLERRLDTRLLTRTTRRVALTSAGVLLRPHCQRLLREVDAVRARFARVAGGAQRLRVRVDAGYGRLLVNPLVPRFLERYPDLELQIAMLQTMPADAGADWDVLICAGEQASAGLASTTLASLPQLLWATPAYLQRHGRPRQPADLGRHVVMQAQQTQDGDASLRMRHAGHAQSVAARTALRVTDPALVHSCAAASLGIGVLPEFLCRQGEAKGRLERVLPGWSVEPILQLRAFHASDREGAVAIRQFLEFLLANLLPLLDPAV